jgi:hypothetical protein
VDVDPVILGCSPSSVRSVRPARLADLKRSRPADEEDLNGWLVPLRCSWQKPLALSRNLAPDCVAVHCEAAYEPGRTGRGRDFVGSGRPTSLPRPCRAKGGHGVLAPGCENFARVPSPWPCSRRYAASCREPSGNQGSRDPPGALRLGDTGSLLVWVSGASASTTSGPRRARPRPARPSPSRRPARRRAPEADARRGRRGRRPAPRTILTRTPVIRRCGCR